MSSVLVELTNLPRSKPPDVSYVIGFGGAKEFSALSRKSYFSLTKKKSCFS